MSLDIGIKDIRKATGVEIELYSGNYTHNVTPMWHKAGIYESLYKSDGKQPNEIIENLREGLIKMVDNKEEYISLNPKNGWGDYESALEFLRNVIKGCEEYPDAKLWVWG